MTLCMRFSNKCLNDKGCVTMRKIIAFENTSLDGYFVDDNGDMSWAHRGSVDDEFNAFVSENNSGESEFIFGRKTYELMASYWPTPMAQEQNPIVAETMNSRSKHVFPEPSTN